MPQEGVTLKLSVFVVLGTPEAVARYRQAVIEAKRWVCKEFEVMEKDILLAPTCLCKTTRHPRRRKWGRGTMCTARMGFC